MSLREKLGLKLLHQLDPERAHGLSIQALKLGLAPLHGGPVQRARLETSMGGIALHNPVGLAAGYDKNAEALAPMAMAGFGFLEVGAATPRPQPGNPKPRLFRLTKDQAVINRFGFNNQGIAKIAARLAQNPTAIPRGLNLGANKDSADRADDFGLVLTQAAPHIDFATVNISSPNTEKLRDLQGKAALENLLGRVNAANANLDSPLPIFLKIAPDLDDTQVSVIAATLQKHGMDGVIATNTTLARPGFFAGVNEAGGLSGLPLRARSTEIIRYISRATHGRLPIIGVGGILSGYDAVSKIEAGADVVQIYTGLIYKGPALVHEVAKSLKQISQN